MIEATCTSFICLAFVFNSQTNILALHYHQEITSRRRSPHEWMDGSNPPSPSTTPDIHSTHSYVVNKRWNEHGSTAPWIGFVAFVNLIWFVFPALGMKLCYDVIMTNASPAQLLA
jgi:hypothetical protein